MLDQDENPFVGSSSLIMREETDSGGSTRGRVGLSGYVDSCCQRNIRLVDVGPGEDALLLSPCLGSVVDSVLDHPVTVRNIPRIVRGVPLFLAESLL